LETVQFTGETGSYTRAGNIPCANQPPVARLTGSPLVGNAPLTFTFDAGASTDPLSCAHINSYLIDFGDGTGATQTCSATCPGGAQMFIHQYANPGAYAAQLAVKDNFGQTSTNPAEVVVTVNSAAPPQLASVKSRMIHGNNVGAKDIDLPLTGPVGVECRTGATSGNYTMVFNFTNLLTSVDQATITGGAGQIQSGAIGPDQHQYIVNLTGVTNAQRLTVALLNAHDSTNKIGNVSATMGVLLGDVNGDGFVLSGDYTAVRQKSGTPVDDATFRFDINSDGFILSGDYTTARQRSGTQLP
jgi:PKD repeat protein